ncbi:AraC family transcriptional regulator [Microbulbifer thermotolerans]|uniref:AraC family transcriptional regulator n=1 Tax=Microbulbifer thermotolerans TaxID=252514 RepID=A0AB35I0R0_MICTH|nr:AraC family transcriptional regulator [Microbulbifer thermotolerans]MCX2795434.1 AraC family transcriptional regulator [Microbulbifer thermotolerans]MCX2802736.1 AraC family transcriptional regulator [Microbulbifer thermotolerans]WKT59993.1 AraC family transcriptional regulator [Microbulbifer thermotolerans]
MSKANLLLDLRSYDRETRRHLHDYHQLVLPVSGTLETSIAGREGCVDRGRGALIAAGAEHAFAAAAEDNRFIVADIPAALAPELERLPAFIPLDAALGHYAAFLQAELESSRSASSQGQRQMVLLLVQLLTERYGGEQCIDRRIQAARAWIDEHLAQPLPLARLAAVAHLSPRRLSELFKRSYGMTPHQYQLERRMQRAWSLLERGEFSVERIAEEVGYSSLSAFSDRFRRHFGKSPSHFRK